MSPSGSSHRSLFRLSGPFDSLWDKTERFIVHLGGNSLKHKAKNSICHIWAMPLLATDCRRSKREDVMRYSVHFVIWSSIFLAQVLSPGCAGDPRGSKSDKDAEPDDTDTTEGDSSTGTAQDTEQVDSEQQAIDTDGTCTGDASPCEELVDVLCYVQTGCVSNAFCAGSARRCESIVLLDNCQRQQDCIFDGSCLGNAVPCSNLSSTTSCNSQRGCTWDSIGQRCSGKAFSCFQLGPETCSRQRGCTLDGSCKGVAVECDALATNSCAGQLGCRVEKECNGVSATCDSLVDYWRCEDQRGCSWD